MVNDYMLDKILDRIKEIISIWKCDDTNILINTNDKLPGYLTLKNVVILTTCAIKDNVNFYPHVLSNRRSIT